MELFDENGCLTDEGLQALTKGQLDEMGRLEAAEHLSYCDRCMDRYTALLTADVLESADLVIVTTAHTTVDYDFVAQHADLVFDTKNAMKHVQNRQNIRVL